MRPSKLWSEPFSTTSFPPILCANLDEEFSQGRDWFEVSNKFSGEKVAEVGYFAGCPWMRVYLSIETQKRIEELESSNTFSMGPTSSPSGSGVVAPLTKAAELSLQQHRLQGHVPHHPNCLQCAKGRTTFCAPT